MSGTLRIGTLSWGSPTLLGPLVAQWDAQAITGIADGNGLLQWPNSVSSNDLLWLSGTGTQPPLYWNSTTANLINGHPAVRFPSSTPLAGMKAISTLGTPAAGPLSVMAVAKAVSLGNDTIVGGGLGTGIPSTFFLGIATGPGAYWSLGSNTNGVAEGTADTVAHMFVGVLDATGTQCYLYVDGTAYGPLNVGNVGFNPAAYVGCFYDSAGVPQETWGGFIGEVRIYNDARTPAQVAALRSEMQTKWGTP